MATQNDLISSSPNTGAEENTAQVEKLHMNAIGIVGLVAGAAGAVAPLAAMFFNVPSIVTQAGAATPLVFLISALGMILFAVSLVYFSRRISSAGGLYSWVSISLGAGAGYSAGWLMLGGYALFEAASAAAFGGLTDNTLSSLLNIHLIGGWVTYSLLAIILVSALAYFDVKWSARVLTPFLALEIGSLLVLDLAILFQGGASGQDVIHTFTTAGSTLKGVFPGGILGIGVGMALGVWSFVGAEQGVAFGEEVRFPRKAIPYGLFGVFAGVGLLFILTTYAAVIGLGWQNTASTLGNLANAPTPYFTLASRYAGGWLIPILYVTISTSTFAAILAFHNGMIRYLYAMGREQVLPQWLGKAHPRWKSPYTASLVQSAFSFLVVIFLALVIQHTNADGSTSYALGIADGKVYQQTDGIASYGWLAIIGTMNFIVVYILVNIAAPFYARRHKEFHVLLHVVAPLISSLVLLIPLVSFVFPAIPGPIGNYFTGLGFFPTPFPLNILPIFPVIWLIIGWGYTLYLMKTNPARLEKLGRIVRGENDLEVMETGKASAGDDPKILEMEKMSAENDLEVEETSNDPEVTETEKASAGDDLEVEETSNDPEVTETEKASAENDLEVEETSNDPEVMETEKASAGDDPKVLEMEKMSAENDLEVEETSNDPEVTEVKELSAENEPEVMEEEKTSGEVS